MQCLGAPTLTLPVGAEFVQPEPPPIPIEVTSEPAGAKVFASDGTKPLGVTPYTFEAPSGTSQISLRVELEGYESAEVALPSDQNGAAHLVLRTKPVRRQPDARQPRKSSVDDEFGYR